MGKAIGYDIDNVLKPTFQLGLELVNRDYGTSYTLEDFKHPTYEESFNLGKDDIDRMFRQAYDDGLLSKLRPIRGARRVVNRYHKCLDQYFITARSPWMRDMTLEWFDRNGFLYVAERVIFGGNTPQKKAGIAKCLGLGLFVEDNLHNANAIAEEASVPVLLVDFGYPFNRGRACHELVKIVCDWKEINQEIKRVLHPF